MTKTWARNSLFAFVLVICPGCSGAVDTPIKPAESPQSVLIPPSVNDEQEIAALISRLGDRSFVVRRSAEENLAKIGEPALQSLRDAMYDNRDPEIRNRSLHLVSALESRLGLAPAARVKGVEFRVVTDSYWPLPPPGGRARIRLGLRIKNCNMERQVFHMMDRVVVCLRTADGDLLVLSGGRDGTKAGPYFSPVLSYHDTYDFAPFKAELRRRDDGNKLCLTGEDGFGGYWLLGEDEKSPALRVGLNFISIRYCNVEHLQTPEGLVAWKGEAQTPPFAIEVK